MKRLTAIHGWSAVVLGLLLYAVIATGAVAVFATEIGRWSAGGVRAAEPLEDPIDARIRRLAAEVEPEYRHDIGIWAGERPRPPRLLPYPCGEPRDRARWTTSARSSASTPTPARCSSATTASSGTSRRPGRRARCGNFLVDLHVQLYLPSPWGLILTGDPRADDDGGGRLGPADASPPDPRPLRRRAPGRAAGLGARPPRAGGELEHPLRLRARLHRLVLQLRRHRRPSRWSRRSPSAATRRRCSRRSTSRRWRRTRRPTPLASLDYILADSRARADGPVTYVDIARLRPGRRARACLARPGGGRAALRHATSTTGRAGPSSAGRRRSAPRPRPAARSTG